MQRWTVLFVIASAALLGSLSIAKAQEPSPEDVIAKFATLSRSEIETMGYVESTPCIDASTLTSLPTAEAGIPASAAVGIHFVNAALIDATLDPLHPESIQLGPRGDVWNVEYVIPAHGGPPEFLGQILSYVEGADVDVLHLWLLDNPLGQFAEFNPSVTCAVPTLPPTEGSGGVGPAARENSRPWWPLALAGSAAIVILLTAQAIWRRLR